MNISNIVTTEDFQCTSSMPFFFELRALRPQASILLEAAILNANRAALFTSYVLNLLSKYMLCLLHSQLHPRLSSSRI